MPSGPAEIGTHVKPDNIEMGLAVVEIDGTEYAARSVSISHEIDYHTPDIPGVLGPVDGLSYLTQFVPQAEIEMLDYDGSPFSNDSGYELPMVGDVKITGYLLRSGDPYETTLKNGMVTDFGKEYPGQSEEATQTMTIVGTYGINSDDEVETTKPIEFNSGSSN